MLQHTSPSTLQRPGMVLPSSSSQAWGREHVPVLEEQSLSHGAMSLMTSVNMAITTTTTIRTSAAMAIVFNDSPCALAFTFFLLLVCFAYACILRPVMPRYAVIYMFCGRPGVTGPENSGIRTIFLSPAYACSAIFFRLAASSALYSTSNCQVLLVPGAAPHPVKQGRISPVHPFDYPACTLDAKLFLYFLQPSGKFYSPARKPQVKMRHSGEGCCRIFF